MATAVALALVLAALTAAYFIMANRKSFLPAAAA